MPNLQDLVFVDEPVSTPPSNLKVTFGSPWNPELQSEEPKDFTPPEGWLPYFGRNTIAGLEKIPESALALNELLVSAGKGVKSGLPQGLQTIEPQAIGEYLPTSEKFRESAEKTLGYSPGAFTPEGFGERVFQEIIGSGALSAATGGLINGFKIPGFNSFLNNIKPIIGSAILGNTAEELGEALNLPPSLKSGLRLSGALLGGAWGTRSAVKKDMKSAYDAIEKEGSLLLPENAIVKSPKINQVADKLLSKLEKQPGYENIKPAVEQFKNLASNQDRIPIRDAYFFNKRLNELYPGYPDDIRREFVNPMRNALKDDLSLYGKVNPDFSKVWETAKEDFKALQGGTISNKLKKTALSLTDKPAQLEKIGKYGTIGLKWILGSSVPISAYFLDPIFTTAIGSIGYGLREIDRFSHLVLNSPSAKHHLEKAFINLAAGNSVNAVNHLNKVNKELEKEETSIQDRLVFS